MRISDWSSDVCSSDLPTTSWCFDIVSWIFLARTFAFFASFADQNLYAPPAGFMVRVQFQTPEQAARNDRWKSSRWEHWVKTGLPLMALSGDNRVMNAPDCSDPLVIAGKRYHSRLLTGTGKFKDMDETARASEAAGAQ